VSGGVIAERSAPAQARERRSLPAVVQGIGGYELLLAALLGLMAAGRMWLVPQYFKADTWLALTAGRDVWASGVPHHETLTALASGREWVDQQWLAHLASYGLYEVGGFALIGALSVVLAAGSFAAVTVVAGSLGARARTLLLLMPVTAFPFFAQSWQPRTQMFAYPLFAAVFVLLLLDCRRPSSRVLLVLPLLVLWANLHGSAVLGAALIVMRGLVMLWEQRGRGWRIAAALIAVPPVALLLTPYGIGTARYYSDTLLNGAFKELATEWQPVTHDPVLILPFLALVVLTAWTLVRGRRGTTLWERLALVLLVVGAANAVRNMVWLTLGALPVLALALDRKVAAGAPPSAFGMRLNRGLAVTGAIAILVALGVTLARPTSAFERDYPRPYLDSVVAAAAADPGATIVADVGDADWMLWRAPVLRGRIAFDARLELLSAAGVRDIASLLRGRSTSLSGAGGARIFALDRRAAGATIQQLNRVPGRRIVFLDAHHVVIALPPR
jgi:hypothetical protein